MRSGGGSFSSTGVHVGEDGWTHLSTYEDHAPILSVDAGSTSVTFYIEGHKVTAAAVKFARDLADRAARFAAEMERMHARRQPGGNGSNEGGSPAGEAA